MNVVDASLQAERNGYLVTTGRVSGLPRETEIWFTVDGDTIYLFSGVNNNKDWFRNLTRTPRVRFRIRDRWFDGVASVPTLAPDVRERLQGDFHSKYYGGRLTGEQDWTRTATLVAITLDTEA